MMRENTEFKEVKGIGRIPVDWEVKELKNICEILDSKRKPIKQEERIKGNIPYYGATGIIDFVNDYIFDDDVILVGEDGENLVSRVLPMAFRVSGKSWVNNHAHVIKPYEDNIDYVTYYLEKVDYTLYITGTAQPKLNQEKLNSIKILLPPIKEQEKIAKILSNVDMNIEKTEQAICKYKQVKKGLMDDLLTGKIRIKDGKRFKETRFKEVKGVGKIPWDWEVGVYSDLASINPTKNIGNLNSLDIVSFIAMEDTSEEAKIIKMTNRTLKEVEKGYTYFEDDDILFAKITPCLENGKGGLVKGLTNGIGFGSTEFHVFRPNNKKSRDFLYQHSKSERMRKKAASLMIGSAGQQRIQKEFFYEYIIGIPNEDEQSEIGDILNHQDMVIEIEENYLGKLKKLKLGLMEDLLTGKIRVNLD